MEALACLKLSTVHANHGQVEDAEEIAKRGLDLAPTDAFATRLRLQGNLAITATWMNDSLEDVVRACRSVVAESRDRGFDHFAAIGLHNMGVAERYMGRIDDSIRSLRQAADFWAGIPASPFADNAELVQSLLAQDQARAAELVSDAAMARTRPWPRPNAEAHYGRAAILAHRGRFDEASETLGRLLLNPTSLGPTAELATALLVECRFLGGADQEDLARMGASLVNGDRTDPRQAPIVAGARAISVHCSKECSGECLSEESRLREWSRRGATAAAAIGQVKIGALALLHQGSRAKRLARAGLRAAVGDGPRQATKYWLRLYANHATWLAANLDALEDFLLAGSADPEGWRDPLMALLPSLAGEERARVLRFLGRHSSRETTRALGGIPGTDVAETRRILLNRQAPKVFVTTLGAMTVHRGSWKSMGRPVERKRMRTLLGLLAARMGTALTREFVIDELWPDATPAAGVNNLNQAVFQLRRVFDPGYKDGESPQYVISTVDVVQLNSEIVQTDIEAIREFGNRLRDNPSPEDKRSIARELIRFVKGEFLAELRYEDWAARAQVAVHSELRHTILPLVDNDEDLDHDLGVALSSALLSLDPYDEAAQTARATRLARSGRRAAARETLNHFVRQLRADFDEPPSERVATMLTELSG